MNDKTLASLVKETREKIGISQRELSRRTGIDNNTLAKIEKGERKKPNVLSLRKISFLLNVYPHGSTFNFELDFIYFIFSLYHLS